MAQLQRLAIAPAQILDQRITLTPEQWHYLSRVLRLQSGDRFIAIDGQGHWWLAAIAPTAQQATLLEPVLAQTELPISITLMMALPKTGMDDIVRQATELGVDRIQPIISRRTLLQPSSQKLSRWQRIAQEAAEQSERQTIPDVLMPIALAEALQWKTSAVCYLCQARGSYPHLLQRLSQEHAAIKTQLTVGLPDRSDPQFTDQSLCMSPHPGITLAIGPEGGWTEDEVAAAIAAGYQPVSLGARILRATTAPVVALSLIASVFEAMPEANSGI
jgi:16S rRNA (uracil1498-N3)-methyltransferase